MLGVLRQKVDHALLRAFVFLQAKKSGEITEKAVMWAIIIVGSLAILGTIGSRLVSKLNEVSNALS